MDTGPSDQSESMKFSQVTERHEKIAKGLLVMVKKRRKMVRAYKYFSWFAIFFASFLGNLSLKEVRGRTCSPFDLSYSIGVVLILFALTPFLLTPPLGSSFLKREAGARRADLTWAHLQNNSQLFAVDGSIKNRVVNILPRGGNPPHRCPSTVPTVAPNRCPPSAFLN